eukprot:SAG31_NODE_133_length_23315_cov_4.858847_5_plen_243_part_00
MCASADHQFGYTKIIPHPDLPNDMIAVFWTDLDPGLSTGVPSHIYTFGNSSAFIIQWDQIPVWGAPPGSIPATFQCILKGDGRIILQYKTLPTSFSTAGPLIASGQSLPAIGLESIDGREGEQISFGDEEFVANLVESAILIPVSCEIDTPGVFCNYEAWSITVFRALNFDQRVSDPTCTFFEQVRLDHTCRRLCWSACACSNQIVASVEPGARTARIWLPLDLPAWRRWAFQRLLVPAGSR